MSYEVEYDKWLRRHLTKRYGERKDALKRGHGFGNRLFVEKIWWLLLGHFNGLHPEYEVKDWRGRSYFVDFMWIVNGHLFVFEIMDFGSHGKDRSKYRKDINRGLFLQSLGCHYIEISLDELKDNPSFIISMLQSILAPYLAAATQMNGGTLQFNKIERQLMRMAVRQNRIIRPAKAAKELELHKDTVIKYCRILVEKGKFRAVPFGISGRVYKYEYIGSLQSPDLI